jgi:hypothetical protein
MEKNLDDANYMPSVFWFGVLTRTLVFVFLLACSISWSFRLLTSPVLPIAVSCIVVIILAIFLRFFFLAKRVRYIAACFWATAGILAILILGTYFIWVNNVPYANFINPAI